MGTGAVYCQIFDYVYPGAIQMNRVKWSAKTDYDYVENFKLLQKGFDKQGQKKYIEVQKLSKCKYQDNLEFSQWLKALYDMHGGYREGYDPNDKRADSKVTLLGEQVGGKTGFSGMDTKNTKMANSVKAPNINNKMKLNNNTTKDVASGSGKNLQSKKENLLATDSNRPIKKITGANDKAKLTETEEQMMKVLQYVGQDADPIEIVHKIR